MKTQILFALALVAGFTASHANAIAFNRQLASCSQQLPDAGITVLINESVVGLLPNPQTTYEATISQETIAGPTKPKSIKVDFSQGSGMGAPEIYNGTNFELEINVDGLPSNGLVNGFVKAVIDGNAVNGEVTCDLSEI